MNLFFNTGLELSLNNGRGQWNSEIPNAWWRRVLKQNCDYIRQEKIVKKQIYESEIRVVSWF